MRKTGVPPETESAFETLTSTLTRLGQVADALYIYENKKAALAFVSDSRLSWEYRREVAQLAERYSRPKEE